MSTYNCRVCDKLHSIDHDAPCLGCGAKEPWYSVADLEKRKQYEYWAAEESRHARAYNELINRFAGAFRFGKQINFHVDKANEAQREKMKYI